VKLKVNSQVLKNRERREEELPLADPCFTGNITSCTWYRSHCITKEWEGRREEEIN
jgi:hypothetical protein